MTPQEAYEIISYLLQNATLPAMTLAECTRINDALAVLSEIVKPVEAPKPE